MRILSKQKARLLSIIHTIVFCLESISPETRLILRRLPLCRSITPSLRRSTPLSLYRSTAPSLCCQGGALLRTAPLLRRSTTLSLYWLTAPPLHRSVAREVPCSVPLHRSVALLPWRCLAPYGSAAPTLRRSITPSLHDAVTLSPHRSAARLLLRSVAPPLGCSVALLPGRCLAPYRTAAGTGACRAESGACRAETTEQRAESTEHRLVCI